jgi:hypothetical protein
MLMSFFSDEIDAENDKQLAEYVDDVEAKVGKPGVAEKVVAKFKWITGHTSLWWLVQKEGIETWLRGRRILGDAVFREKGSWDEIDAALCSGPVIIGTNKMGGLPNGHIILLTGKEDGVYFANDPYGDAMSNYTNMHGEGVEYPETYLKKYADMNYMYWSEL